MLWAAAGFLIAVLPAALTPGVSLTLTVSATVRGTQHAARWVIAGTATGILVHATLATAGLSAVVLRSSEVFAVIRFLGGVYLLVLGLVTLRRAARHQASTAQRQLPWTGHHPYVQALLGNVLNPKAALVYLTLAPAFLTPSQTRHGGILALSVVHVAVMAAWLSLWSFGLRRGGQLLDTRAFRVRIERAGGALLVVFGVRSIAATR